MNIDCTINIIDFLALLVAIVTGLLGLGIFKKLSAREKYQHEQAVAQEIKKQLEFGQELILADIKKYNVNRTDVYNKTYYKQGAEYFSIIPEYGLQVILVPSQENKIPIATIPFEWIEYVREYDSEDNKVIVVCKFKGIKYFKKFKSPFSTIEHYQENRQYTEGQPNIFRYKRNEIK